MEDTLRADNVTTFEHDTISLNPCFNGRYSQRNVVPQENYIRVVLILVLMEDTLREQEGNIQEHTPRS